MIALVTGASSGIGYDIAKYLSSKGYDIIAIARNKDKLEKLKEECATNVEIYIVDLSKQEEVEQLYEKIKSKNIDVLVNNAGFGAFGSFENVDYTTQLEMIDVNIKALHVLTYLFLRDMKKRDSGYILNIGSVAGFLPGPLMTEYYATKAYVLRLTQGINKELRKEKSNVYVSVCCPGPVSTNFNIVAGVKFGLKAKTSDFVAKKAVEGMFKRKEIICPGISEWFVKLSRKLFSDKILAEVSFHMQKKKDNKRKK